MLADRDPKSNTEATPPLEIERVWLLDRLPDLPPQAQAHRIEQGYLPDDASDEAPFAEGRLRRKVAPDGTVACFHTIKRGAGMVREEIEETLTEAEFAAGWAKTEGRRLSKTRYKVKEGSLTWEVDAFDDWGLVMAEVELPTQTTEAPLPAWLAPHVVRELTDDPRYRNFALATQGPPQE